MWAKYNFKVKNSTEMRKFEKKWALQIVIVAPQSVEF